MALSRMMLETSKRRLTLLSLFLKSLLIIYIEWNQRIGPPSHQQFHPLFPSFIRPWLFAKYII